MYRRFNQSYFYNNANQHKAEKKLITIVDRVSIKPKASIVKPNPIHTNNIIPQSNNLPIVAYRVPITSGNNYNMPYSVKIKDIPYMCKFISYPGVTPIMYTIDTNGVIKNYNTGKTMTAYEYWNNGYAAVTLQTPHKGGSPFMIHRLVAYQFCNPPINIKNMVVNHIDGNKLNNYAGNLEWMTVAANNQHAINFNQNTSTFSDKGGRPIVNETFVRYLCEQFEAGKSNTEIMHGLKLTIDNANHTLFRDIRGGYTWTHITSQYNFARSSKKHAYTPEQKETIRQYILQGMNDFEVFKIMVGRDYVASTDRKDSSYRTIHTIREALRRKGHNV